MIKKLLGIAVMLLALNSCVSTSDYYDFRNLEVKESLGEFNLKLNQNAIVFSSNYPKNDAPLAYLDSYSDLNFNEAYRLTTAQDTLIFRFSWISYKNKQNILKPVRWLTNPPENSATFIPYNISRVRVPFMQKGSIRVCTIGDSQTWRLNALSFRKKINQINSEFVFVGSNTDMFGYGHEAEGGNNTAQVVARMHKIPAADYYTILLGTNDFKLGQEQAFNNITLLVNYILKTYPKANVLYYTPLPTINPIRDAFNAELSKELVQEFNTNPRVATLDLRAQVLVEGTSIDNKYLGDDGLHPSKEGVALMAQLFTQYFKN